MNKKNNKKLTHFDDHGNPSMVDISLKKSTPRIARAESFISMSPKTLNLIKKRNIDKGDVLQVANLAGVFAAKKCDQLIPLCHSLNLSNIQLKFETNFKESHIRIISEISLVGKTGAEMEALLAVSIASLTIYDMCKSVDNSMIISSTKLTYKEGGKSGIYINE